MELGLEGKVALVGGGSRGLGRASAEALAAEGAKVAIYARGRERLEAAAEEIRSAHGTEVVAIPLDVRDAGDCARGVERTVAALGGLDVLVTNMSSDEYKGDILGEPDEAWREDFELYTMSVIRLARLAVPHMRERGGGSIVNITSCGMHQAISDLALSEVARFATTGFAKFLATELAADGVRVNNVLPGWIEGELIDEIIEDDAASRGVTTDAVFEESLAAIPMGRFGTAREVANAIALLASDRAAYVTGTNLRVDGGWAQTPAG